MKGKLKKILSKKIFYVILGIVIVGVVEIVYASNLINSKNVSYCNETSKLNSTNVQGAIDELYNSCEKAKATCPDGKECFTPSAKTTIIKLGTDIVSSGDGLYHDETEHGKYFYRGANVKNYIKFNNELWRILSINQDGTIKIVKDGYYSTSIAWDTSNNNNWSRSATLNTELNNIFYNSLGANVKNIIKTSTWNIGTIQHGDERSLSQDIFSEKNDTWIGKIALFTVSEYVRTNSNKSCFNGIDSYNINYETCRNTTWLHDHGISQWLLSAYSDNSYDVWMISSDDISDGKIVRYSANITHAVRPALNLKSSVKITGGTGEKNNPLILE